MQMPASKLGAGGERELGYKLGIVVEPGLRFYEEVGRDGLGFKGILLDCCVPLVGLGSLGS